MPQPIRIGLPPVKRDRDAGPAKGRRAASTVWRTINAPAEAMRHHGARRMARCSSRLDCESQTHDALQDTNDSSHFLSLHWRRRPRAAYWARQWPRARSDGRCAPGRRDRSGGGFTRADGGDGRDWDLPLRYGPPGHRRVDLPAPQLQRAATVGQRHERSIGERRRRPDALAQRRCNRDGCRHVSQRR